MKIQDVIFFAFLIMLFFRKDPRLATIFGILSLFISIPLFAFWIFFTAERLTWYAGAFFLLAVVLFLIQSKKE